MGRFHELFSSGLMGALSTASGPETLRGVVYEGMVVVVEVVRADADKGVRAENAGVRSARSVVGGPS